MIDPIKDIRLFGFPYNFDFVNIFFLILSL